MSNGYVLIASRDPFTCGEVERFYELGAALHREDHGVTLFIVQSGVLPARPQPHSSRLSQLGPAARGAPLSQRELVGENANSSLAWQTVSPRRPSIATVPCGGGDRYRSRLWNREFLKAKDLPIASWLCGEHASRPTRDESVFAAAERALELAH